MGTIFMPKKDDPFRQTVKDLIPVIVLISAIIVMHILKKIYSG